MAISTDATLQDFLVSTSETSAEVRSFASGSGSEIAPSLDAIRKEKLSGDDLKTGADSSYGYSFAVTREGARKIGELTSNEEYDSLISQRHVLARKQLDDSLSKSEALQLGLIEWTINCVEKSRAGLSLDSLQSIAKAHEIIAERVTRTADQLQSIIDAENGRNAQASRRRSA